MAAVELLFCFPIANGTLERVFSQLKQIKDDARCSLNESTLDNLLRISVEAPPLSDWCAKGALDLWFKEKSRRIEHKDTYKRRTTPKSSNDQSDEDSTEQLVFDLDEWFQSDLEESEVEDADLINLNDWDSDTT